jgi:hypothetical protein
VGENNWKLASVEPPPKDGSPILARVGQNDFRILRQGWFDVNGNQPVADPTEWMPLPK